MEELSLKSGRMHLLRGRVTGARVPEITDSCAFKYPFKLAKMDVTLE